jgi:hypothetical protein
VLLLLLLLVAGLFTCSAPGTRYDGTLPLGWLEEYARRLAAGVYRVQDAPELNQAGLYTLTPPDPQLKGAWYPGGFNP